MFPAASVAVQVTVVVPRANCEPEAAEQTGVRVPSVLSVAETVPYVTRAPAALVASTVGDDGADTTGLTAALITISNEAEPLFPRTSVAVQVTVVVPIGYVAPDATEQDTPVAPSRASVALAV
jgi:hypothetical protein